MKRWPAYWCYCSLMSRVWTPAVYTAFSVISATTHRLGRGSLALCFPFFSTSLTACSPQSFRPRRHFLLAWRRKHQFRPNLQVMPTWSLWLVTIFRHGLIFTCVLLLGLRRVFSTCSVVPSVPLPIIRQLVASLRFQVQPTYQFIRRHHH